MSLFLFCVTAHDFFRMQKTMEQTVFIFFELWTWNGWNTKNAEYRFANKNCRLYCNTDLPWKMPCFKSADTEDSVESNTVHNPTKFGPGVLIKVLYDASETLPRGPTPYPLLYAFWQKKRPKRANRCILWLSKSRKNALVLWFIRIEKTVHLQRLKGEAKF